MASETIILNDGNEVFNKLSLLLLSCSPYHSSQLLPLAPVPSGREKSRSLALSGMKYLTSRLQDVAEYVEQALDTGFSHIDTAACKRTR
jgi:hypothetical protein